MGLPRIGRLVLVGGLAYLLLLLGLATLNGSLLAMALPLVIYLAAALLHGPQGIHLQVTRTLSTHRVHEDTPVEVSLTLTNAGSRLEEVLLQDLVPQHLAITDGESEVLASLGPGETIEIGYTVTGQRGDFRFRAVQVTSREALGLFERQVSVPAPAQLSLLPNAPRLRQVPIRPFRTRGYAGPIPARQGGSGTDFYGVREYEMGDPRRWINWRVSARHPRALFTNQFERERIADVGLILDARKRTDLQVPGDSLFSHAVRATSALAEAFLRAGNRVGLLVYGEFLDWTLPGYGKVQRERILQALARAETGESHAFEHLDFLPTRLFPAQSQLVLVSPLGQDDLQTLIRLRAHGYQVLVIQPDPIPFELQTLDPGPAVELAARIVSLQRALLLLKLRQAGIQVVGWQVHKPFDQVLHGALGRAPQWFRALGWEQVP
jgi:uncharacterized protein (DUF58 family)